MSSMLNMLKDAGLVDSAVLAVGIERDWATRTDVAEYATGQLIAGDERTVVVELAEAEHLERARLTDLLRLWAGFDIAPSQREEAAVRRWMFAALADISESDANDDEKLDGIEEAYAAFGYPEEMRECSRYYVPPQDRGIRVGETTASPLRSLSLLLSRLRSEFGCERPL